MVFHSIAPKQLTNLRVQINHPLCWQFFKKLTWDTTKHVVILCGIFDTFLVKTNTTTTQTQAMTPRILTSKVNSSNWFTYSEGLHVVIVIIFAETNIKGALMKVQATIAVAIYEVNLMPQESIIKSYRKLTKSTSIRYWVAKTNTPGAVGKVP